MATALRAKRSTLAPATSKDGKVTGSVHRVVSADGKTLTVHNKGTHADGTKYDDTLVYDRQ
jgi:hypothetical protein